jgi:beta-lactamase regulating signal transducer with metallopeptidase domain
MRRLSLAIKLLLALVALLAFALKENQARVRYWLWLAASLKFLIPFCLVVTAGQRLAPSSAATNTQLHQVVSAVGYAFAPPILETGSSTPSIQVRSSLIEALPVVAGLIWFSGFAVIFLVRYMRWRNLSAMIKRAVPLHAGREVDALRRVGDCAASDTSLPVLLSSSSLEPGIFGVVRPVLVWPEGISEHLDDSHLDAIVAHELWHVRRRDNLVATVHMLVEVLFWFHPLVWWVGAKMVEERERACDEEVLRAAADPAPRAVRMAQAMQC